jgi:hypothetical protein
MLLLATLVHFALPLPILAAPVQGPIILAQLGTYKDSNCKSSPKVIYLIEDQCFQSPGQGTSMEVIGLRNGNDEGQKCQGNGNRVRLFELLTKENL